MLRPGSGTWDISRPSLLDISDCLYGGLDQGHGTYGGQAWGGGGHKQLRIICWGSHN